MSKTFEIPDDCELYAYAIVGVNDNGDTCELVSAFGVLTSKHSEYARRDAVARFKTAFPKARVELAGVIKTEQKWLSKI